MEHDNETDSTTYRSKTHEMGMKMWMKKDDVKVHVIRCLVMFGAGADL